MIEVFSAIRKLLSCSEAESRVGALLCLRRLAFLNISKEACQAFVRLANEQNIPVNDALIASCALEKAEIICTMDMEHFRKLEKQGIKILNPANSSL